VLAAADIRCAVSEEVQVDPLGGLTKGPPWRMTSPGCSHGSDYARSGKAYEPYAACGLTESAVRSLTLVVPAGRV
jgi:hypothetical protein